MTGKPKMKKTQVFKSSLITILFAALSFTAVSSLNAFGLLYTTDSIGLEDESRIAITHRPSINCYDYVDDGGIGLPQYCIDLGWTIVDLTESKPTTVFGHTISISTKLTAQVCRTTPTLCQERPTRNR